MPFQSCIPGHGSDPRHLPAKGSSGIQRRLPGSSCCAVLALLGYCMSAGAAAEPTWWPDPSFLSTLVPEGWVTASGMPIQSDAQLSALLDPAWKGTIPLPVSYNVFIATADRAHVVQSRDGIPPYRFGSFTCPITMDGTDSTAVADTIEAIERHYHLQDVPHTSTRDNTRSWIWNPCAGSLWRNVFLNMTIYRTRATNLHPEGPLNTLAWMGVEG